MKIVLIRENKIIKGNDGKYLCEECEDIERARIIMDEFKAEVFRMELNSDDYISNEVITELINDYNEVEISDEGFIFDRNIVDYEPYCCQIIK